MKMDYPGSFAVLFVKRKPFAPQVTCGV